jgi:hypothetical protein
MIDRAIKDKAIPPSMAYLIYHRFRIVVKAELLSSTSDTKWLCDRPVYKDAKWYLLYKLDERYNET